MLNGFGDVAGPKAEVAALGVQAKHMKVVQVPDDWPAKWDLADAPPPGVLQRVHIGGIARALRQQREVAARVAIGEAGHHAVGLVHVQAELERALHRLVERGRVVEGRQQHNRNLQRPRRQRPDQPDGALVLRCAHRHSRPRSAPWGTGASAPPSGRRYGRNASAY